MGVYRLDEASTSRAGCQNKECKEQKLKIQKGELRLGTWIDTERFQSFQWRHWGCVTPKVIAHVGEALGEVKDYSLLDGFDELSSENQDRVRKALEQGHVDDSDWKGDTEMNRPGKTGFRSKASKKTEAFEDEVSEAEKKPKGKKRGRGKKDEEDEEDKEEGEEETITKKAKTTGKKTATKDETAGAKPAKRGKPRKGAEETAKQAEADAEEAPKKAARGRKKKALIVEEGDDGALNGDGTDDLEPKPSKKARKAAEPKATGQKGRRGRPKKASAGADE